MSGSTNLNNPDLAPTSAAQRTWSTWHIAALWIGMAVCVPTYTVAAGMIEAGMSWWQAVLTVALGNCIVLVPMMLNGHAGTRYGIPFPVLMRASFGTTGANIPALARALVACGWFGIQTWIGGAAIHQLLGAIGVIDLAAEAGRATAIGLTPWQALCFMVFWLVNVHFVWHGMHSIRWLEAAAAPFLIVAGLVLLGWAFYNAGPGTLSAGSKFATNAEFWAVFVPQLTAMVGFWATLSLNIPDFTRFAASQRSQAVGQALGLVPTMTLFCFIGIAVTGATVHIFGRAIWDPVELVSKFGSTTVILLSLLSLSVATLSTNIAANVVSPANDFSNLAPRLISFRTGGLITAVLGVLMAPWYLYGNLSAYIFTWLIGYSALLGPIAGIMICDYHLLRRRQLNVADLYDANGPFRGVNWRTVLALLLAVAPSVPGFLNAATHQELFAEGWNQLYDYAWFVGFFLGVLFYWLLRAGRALPAGR